MISGKAGLAGSHFFGTMQIFKFQESKYQFSVGWMVTLRDFSFIVHCTVMTPAKGSNAVGMASHQICSAGSQLGFFY